MHQVTNIRKRSSIVLVNESRDSATKQTSSYSKIAGNRPAFDVLYLDRSKQNVAGTAIVQLTHFYKLYALSQSKELTQYWLLQGLARQHLRSTQVSNVRLKPFIALISEIFSLLVLVTSSMEKTRDGLVVLFITKYVLHMNVCPKTQFCILLSPNVEFSFMASTLEKIMCFRTVSYERQIASQSKEF